MGLKQTTRGLNYRDGVMSGRMVQLYEACSGISSAAEGAQRNLIAILTHGFRVFMGSSASSL